MGMCLSVDEETLAIEMGPKVMEKRRRRRRHAAEMARAEAELARSLSLVPSRLVSDGITASSCLHLKQGSKGLNQDCMLVWEGFADSGGAALGEQPMMMMIAAEESAAAAAEIVLCGVFDGHGPNGHHVARKVRDELPSLLLLAHHHHHQDQHQHQHDHHQHQHQLQHQHDDDHHRHRHCANYPSIADDGAFVRAFARMDDALKSHPKINSTLSGTTALILAIVKDKEVVAANVGDSRAILASQLQREDGSFALAVEQLTVDLKPDIPGERERIEECGGRVFALADEPGVARVWMPHDTSPGLSMSRSLGDFCVKSHGVVPTPLVSRRALVPHHDFVVLATDGVWEVLSNEEVARIVSGCSPRANAAKAVVDAARSKWKQQRKHKSVMIDDCACICHFFHGSPLNDHAANRIISQVSEEPRSANNNGSGLL